MKNSSCQHLISSQMTKHELTVRQHCYWFRKKETSRGSHFLWTHFIWSSRVTSGNTAMQDPWCKSHDKNDNVKNSPSKPNTRNGFQFLWIFLLFPLPVMLSNGLPLCAFLLLAQNPKVLCQRTTGLVIGASPASSNTGIVLHSSDLECILCSSFGIFCPGLAFSPCSLSILPWPASYNTQSPQAAAEADMWTVTCHFAYMQR